MSWEINGFKLDSGALLNNGEGSILNVVRVSTWLSEGQPVSVTNMEIAEVGSLQRHGLGIAVKTLHDFPGGVSLEQRVVVPLGIHPNFAISVSESSTWEIL